MAVLHILTLVLITSFSLVNGWDSVEMEVFDVVEEVNENFYDLMGISQNAALPEIKKAYRSLSKQLHPDKSDDPNAEVKFRQMVAVYEVLKDPERREYYDRVLVEGLPDWRSAVYYYRRVRKISMLEIGFILTLVTSITQYLSAWGSYYEQWRVKEEEVDRKFRKCKKKEDEAIAAEFASIPKPRNYLKDSKQRKLEEAQALKEERDEEERIKHEDEERKAKKEASKQRKREKAEAEAKEAAAAAATATSIIYRSPGKTSSSAFEEPIRCYNTGMWSQEELSELTRLMNKYPGGTPVRWEVISNQINRAPHEVTKMAAKLKERVAAGTWQTVQKQDILEVVKVKVKTKKDGEEAGGADENWSVVQQKALERALKALPKGTDQRWQKIAKQVPEKTAEECMCRFRFLAERIKKRKEQEAAKRDESNIEETASDDAGDPGECVEEEHGSAGDSVEEDGSAGDFGSNDNEEECNDAADDESDDSDNLTGAEKKARRRLLRKAH